MTITELFRIEMFKESKIKIKVETNFKRYIKEWNNISPNTES